ncbi:uncharacterized protein [Primulina huaijiensis]|uniref:uncharacterized protein n=1 Tax=Primulina huaijiensis TaxID=1492673 RepID=UPI003CC709FB
MKGVMRFGKKDKLSHRFIGPFEILEEVGILVYRIALSPNLEGVHNVLHVSMLRKYMSNLSHVLDYEPLQLTPNLSFEERPTQILDRQERKLRNKVNHMVKVKCLNHPEEDATWRLKPVDRMIGGKADGTRVTPGLGPNSSGSESWPGRARTPLVFTLESHEGDE